MRSGATDHDMPLQLEFDYRFSRAIKERLKGQCFTPFAYFTVPSLYAGFHQHLLQWFTQVTPSKAKQTIWKTGEWNEELESNVWSECPPKNSAKHDNKGQSRNSAHKSSLYAADSWTVQPLDFTVLSEAAAVPVPHLENKETIYKLSQIVCVKADSSDTRQLFIMACLQDDVTVGMKRVKAKVFVQDPFNPVLFTEHAERYVDVSNTVCASSTKKIP